MKTPFSMESLSEVIALLAIKPIDLVRISEKIWKEKYKGKDLSDSEIVKAMVAEPKLIQRPIVVHGNKAIIARPLEKINEIL